MLEIAFILKLNGNYLQTVWEGFQCVQIRPGWFRQRLLCWELNLWVFTWLQQLLAICHWVWKKSVQSPGKYRLFLVAMSMQSYFYSSVTELLDSWLCVTISRFYKRHLMVSKEKGWDSVFVFLFNLFIYLHIWYHPPRQPYQPHLTSVPSFFSVAHLFLFAAPNILQDTKGTLWAHSCIFFFNKQKSSKLPSVAIWISCENSHMRMQS